MKKYIIILSLFLFSCTKYRVYNFEQKRIHYTVGFKNHKAGDTTEVEVRIGRVGEDIIYKNQKVLILNKTKLWN